MDINDVTVTTFTDASKNVSVSAVHNPTGLRVETSGEGQARQRNKALRALEQLQKQPKPANINT